MSGLQEPDPPLRCSVSRRSEQLVIRLAAAVWLLALTVAVLTLAGA